MRSLALVALLAGCAGAPAAKMAWPYPTGRAELGVAVATPEAAPPLEQGRGGSLTPALPLSKLHPAYPPAHEPGEPVTLTFAWPVATTGVNSLYGTRVDPIDGRQRFHAGIDLQAGYGAVVTATSGGVVTHAGFASGHGRQVTIDHAGGFRSSYSHLAQVLVEGGAQVRAGQPVGLVGNSGRSTGPHLHFELSRFGAPLDPLDLLGDAISVR